MTKGGDTVRGKNQIDNKLTYTSSLCLMFSLFDCLFSKEIHTCIQQNKECKHHIKGQKYFFFEKSSTFSEVQMGHLRACPMHLRLMPTTSLLHNLHNEETRDSTFDYIFHSN